MIALGPFHLLSEIGAGGMGEIWRATHQPTGVPVAIKVIKGPASDEFKEAFLHEVRLVAGLRHRNVVMALEAGTIPPAAAAASEGKLTAGAPFLAMELAGGGSLAGRSVESYRELRHVLVQLFDGLAHAHARGIVHRDIKPGNLLLATERGRVGGQPESLLTARVVVTDFGIGSDREGRDLYEDGAAVGTPNYMAPEQVEAEWRDHGPWTDLYAAGVLAFQLATGAPPFRGANVMLTMMAHVQQPVPPMQPLFDVPPGFEAFVRQLLAKRPTDRYAFAADARRALLGLGDPVVGTRRSARRRNVPSSELPTRIEGLEEDSLITGGAPRPPGLQAGPVRPAAPAQLPLAARWQEEPDRDFLLEGAGLGLYGLRDVPMVARVSERDALWDALVQVRNTGRTRVVVLRGPTGTGKSRLVDWLSRVAHEVGAGLTLKAVAGASGRSGPLTQLAENALRADGLEREELLARVDGYLGDLGRDGAAEVLAQLLAPDRFPDLPSPTEKEVHAALELLLRLVAGARSVLVWLEDAHLQPEALAFALRMLDAREPVPALLLLTIQEEGLAERPEAQELLARVLASPDARALAVGPLPADDHQELVRALLGLEGGLAVKVEEKTQGNPLFAVQLVGDWVARGWLVPSQRGFRLQEGADSEEIPEGLLEVWEDHVARLLATRSEEDAQALELAATLGLELRHLDFRVLCVLARLKPSADLVQELMRRRLAQPVGERDQRWAFSHGMLREVLQRRARQGGRWAAHNRACANHLRASRQVDQERLARHLLDAGDLGEALAPLGKAIADRLARGDYRSSTLLTEQEEALQTLDLPESDPRWGELWLSWAWLFRARGELANAERWTVRTERAARRFGWREELGRALRLGARIERNLGRPDAAMDLARQAEELFRADDDRTRLANCRVLVGELELQQSHLEEARAAFESVLDSASPDDAVDAWMGLAMCAKGRQDPDAMERALEKAREAARTSGRRNALAKIANLQGELARQRGDLAGAEERYREASARFKALDDGGYVYTQINLGLLLALRGAWQEVTVLLEPLVERSERTGPTVPACFARTVLLPCSAGLMEWGDFKEHYRWLKDFLGRRKLVDRDIARMALLAAELAAKADRQDAEAAALLLALPQQVELGDAEGADRTRRRLAELGREAPA